MELQVRISLSRTRRVLKLTPLFCILLLFTTKTSLRGFPTDEFCEMIYAGMSPSYYSNYLVQISVGDALTEFSVDLRLQLEPVSKITRQFVFLRPPNSTVNAECKVSRYIFIISILCTCLKNRYFLYPLENFNAAGWTRTLSFPPFDVIIKLELCTILTRKSTSRSFSEGNIFHSNGPRSCEQLQSLRPNGNK